MPFHLCPTRQCIKETYTNEKRDPWMWQYVKRDEQWESMRCHLCPTHQCVKEMCKNYFIHVTKRPMHAAKRLHKETFPHLTNLPQSHGSEPLSCNALSMRRLCVFIVCMCVNWSWVFSSPLMVRPAHVTRHQKHEEIIMRRIRTHKYAHTNTHMQTSQQMHAHT